MSDFLNNSARVYNIKLKIGILYQMNNISKNRFLDICRCAFKVNSRDLKFCSESRMFEISRIWNNRRLLYFIFVINKIIYSQLIGLVINFQFLRTYRGTKIVIKTRMFDFCIWYFLLIYIYRYPLFWFHKQPWRMFCKICVFLFWKIEEDN